MKSEVYKITEDGASLGILLKESEKTASYANLNKKQTIKLRLLAEEMITMLPELLSFNKGEFWTECNGKTVELHVSLVPYENLTAEKREKILSVSSDGKNAAEKGIISKIKIAVEFMLIDYENCYSSAPAFFAYGVGGDINARPGIWSLDTYRNKAKKDNDEKWDELEKSIIANIADDVIVGLQENKVEITVKKSF